MNTPWTKTPSTTPQRKRSRPPTVSSIWLTPESLDEQTTGPVTNTPVEVKPTVQEAYSTWSESGKRRDASGPLLEALTPTIDAALKSYANGDGNLRTKARIMALDASGRYSAKMGVQLSTYVNSYLRGLNREFIRRSQMVHIPEGARLEWQKLERANSELEMDKGREPTVNELADNTGLSAKKIERLRLQNRGEASEGQLLTEQGESLFFRKDDPQRIWADYVYHELDPVDQKVYEWSTGYGGAKTMKKMDIASRLGISAPAVSARISKIIKKLQEGANA